MYCVGLFDKALSVYWGFYPASEMSDLNEVRETADWVNNVWASLWWMHTTTFMTVNVYFSSDGWGRLHMTIDSPNRMMYVWQMQMWRNVQSRPNSKKSNRPRQQPMCIFWVRKMHRTLAWLSPSLLCSMFYCEQTNERKKDAELHPHSSARCK